MSLDLAALAALLNSPASADDHRLARLIDRIASESRGGDSATAPLTPKFEERTYPDATFRSYKRLGLDVVFSSPPALLSPKVKEGAGSAAGSTSVGQTRTLERIELYNPVPFSVSATALAALSPRERVRARREAEAVHAPFASDIVLRRPRSLITAPGASMSTSKGSAKANGVSAPVTDSGSELATTTTTTTMPTPISMPPAPEPTSVPAPVRDTASLTITRQTTGRDLVAALGEPSRKGGGEGWVGPWLEWAALEVDAADADGVLGDERQSGAPSASAGRDRDGDWGRDRVQLGMMVELRPPVGAAGSGGGGPGASASAPGSVSGDKVHMPFGGVWDMAAAWEWGCIKVFKAQPGSKDV